MKDRTGEKYTTNEGYEALIIKWINSVNCTIQLNDNTKTIIEKVKFGSLKGGQIKNPYHPSVHGVGYIGQGKYKSKENNKRNKVYEVWHSMIQRCYSEKYLKKATSYKEVTVCEEWHNFQNFGTWFDENYKPEYMENWHLDKDILQKGNKIYSPETCCFVPQEINVKYNKTSKKICDAHKYIVFDDIDNKYIIIDFREGKFILVGKSNYIEEAIELYKRSKLKYKKEVLEKYKHLLPDELYNRLLI